MSKKIISQRKKLAAVFSSFAILVMGAASLLRSMSLDYYTVLNTLQKVIPAVVALGSIGWVMGMILDKPRRRTPKIEYHNLFLNDVLKDDVNILNSPTINIVEDLPKG